MAVEVLNAALAHLGEAPVVAPDDDLRRPQGRMLARLPVLRDALLRSYRWNFARWSASLASAPLSAARFGMTHASDLPSGPADDPHLPWCVQVRAVEGDVCWRVEGRRLLHDSAGPVSIDYTRRVEASSLMDPLFFELLAVTLALAMSNSMGVSEIRKRRNELQQMRRELRSEARRSDAVEQSAPALAQGAEPKLLRARRGRV